MVVQSSIRVSDLGREAYSVYIAQSIVNTVKSCLRYMYWTIHGLFIWLPLAAGRGQRLVEMKTAQP